jgi:hypothetical protein
MAKICKPHQPHKPHNAQSYERQVPEVHESKSMGLNLNKSATLRPEKSRNLHFRKGMKLKPHNPMNHKLQTPARASSPKLLNFN